MASVFSLPPSLPGSTKNPDLCLGNPKLERPSRRPSDCCLNSKESLLRYHPRPMARLSVRYRRWGGTSQPTAMTTSTAGTVSFPGPSMHRTRSSRPPRDSSRSSAYSATNLLCFSWTGEPSDVPAVFQVSERVWDSQPMSTSSRQCGDTKTLQMPVGCMPTSIAQEIRYWLSTRDLCLRLPCRKLSPHFIGPSTIERQIHEVTFLLQLPAWYRIHPAFHVSLFKPVSPSVPGTKEPAVPPPPEVQEEPSNY